MGNQFALSIANLILTCFCLKSLNVSSLTTLNENPNQKSSQEKTSFFAFVYQFFLFVFFVFFFSTSISSQIKLSAIPQIESAFPHLYKLVQLSPAWNAIVLSCYFASKFFSRFSSNNSSSLNHTLGTPNSISHANPQGTLFCIPVSLISFPLCLPFVSLRTSESSQRVEPGPQVLNKWMFNE